MFKDSIDAFVREDVALARAVVSRDEEPDDMNPSANRQLSERMMQDRDRLRGYPPDFTFYLGIPFLDSCVPD